MVEQKQSKQVEKLAVKTLLQDLSYADALVERANYQDLDTVVPKAEFLNRLQREKSQKVGGRL